MVKLVIAGSAGCPHYARVELLAEKLTRNLDDVNIHKIVKLPTQWNDWLSAMCQTNGWSHDDGGPIIWRELVDRGGKAQLIGGAVQFHEYAAAYYGVQLTDFTSDDALRVAAENGDLAEQLETERRDAEASIRPVRVGVTAACSQLAHNVLYSLATGSVLGDDVTLAVSLYDEQLEELTSVEDELRHLASPVIHSTSVATDTHTTFTGCDVILLLDDVTALRDGCESRADWLRAVARLYESYAESIAAVCRPDVKLLVIANDVTSVVGAALCHYVPSDNVIISSTLAEKRVCAALARQTAVNAASIVDVVVWGDASLTQRDTVVIDVTRGRVYDCDEAAVWGPLHYRQLTQLVHTDDWLQSLLTPGTTRQTSDMASASALMSLMKCWWRGSTGRHRLHSATVASQGWYGVPSGLFFSFPVHLVTPRCWNVVDDLLVDSRLRTKLINIAHKLIEDVAVVYPTLFSDDEPTMTSSALAEDTSFTARNASVGALTGCD